MVRPDMTDLTVEAILHLIHYGAPDDALAAAKCLGFRARSSMRGSDCLEREGTIRAMMKVRNAMATSPSPCGRWFLS